MRYVAYTSKLYSVVMLLAVAGFGGVIFMVRDKIPLGVQIAFGVLLCLGLAGCIAGLCSSKPVIVADEEGFYCRSLGVKKIAWEDIAAVVHLPRRRKLPNGKTQISMSESRRPIEIYVSNIEKYATGLVAWSIKSRVAVNADHPECACLCIDCGGTTAKSPDLYEYILSHIKGSGEESVPAV